MAKGKKNVEPVTDVKELNWEEPAAEFPAAGRQIPAKGILDALREYMDQVDPEIKKDNPVWKWALCDDHCTFIFRDGRKVVINF